MAERFAADLDKVRALVTELGSVKSDLETLGAELTRSGAHTGSRKVDGALSSFIDDTSDQRDRVKELLDAGIQMLQALVKGTDTVDRELSRALAPSAPSAPAPGTVAS